MSIDDLEMIKIDCSTLFSLFVAELYDFGMTSARVLEAIGVIDSFDRAAASLVETKSAIVAVRVVRGWLDARMLDITARLGEVSPLPSDDLAAGSRSGHRAAEAAMKRAAAAAKMPEFATKLGDGSISTDHVDAAARAMRSLPAKDRAAFAAQSDRLATIAAHSTPEQFEKTARRTADAISSENGTDRLARQKAAARLRMYPDRDTDMFCLSGRFDPETGAQLAARIDAMLASKFAEVTPRAAQKIHRRSRTGYVLKLLQRSS